MQKQYKLTKEGIAELEAEMQKLIADRGAVAERIKTAREFGDLSENAEYSAAREEQGRAETRVTEIDHILKNAEIISSPKKKDIVELGNTVKLVSKDKKTKEFSIVGSFEADPLSGKISDESPIGQALIGKKLGDDVEIKLPAGSTTYTIQSVD